jgi:RND family efflux transporter MFP subunit
MKKPGGILVKLLVQLLLVVVALGMGVLIFMALASMKKPPIKKERPVVAPLVEAITVHPEDLQMIVYGFGTAEPKVSVQVVPQVSGQVVNCHVNFVEGGFFKAGEPLVKIDPRDYELAVENAEAIVAQADYILKQEESEGLVAITEWEALHPDEEPSSLLVLRIPQIKNAQAQLQSAQAKLSRAKLDLERTAVSMPFDGRVVTKNVDHGQYVTPGQPIATVYGTDVIEIVVPLEDDQLEWFDAPLGHTNGNGNGSKPGPEALITTEFAGKSRSWKGRIVRTEGQIDPTSRMIQVVAEVTKPFEQKNHNVPLTPGMFVNVEIKGRQLNNIIRVPRYAVRSDDTIWLAREEKLPGGDTALLLHILPVKIARHDKGFTYISSGISDGDVVITSTLDIVIDQMQIRVRLAESADSDEEAGK